MGGSSPLLGRSQPYLLCSCLYLFNAVLSMTSSGWSSPWTFGWLLMAAGFFVAYRQPSGKLKWFSPAVVTMFLGVGFLLFGLTK